MKWMDKLSQTDECVTIGKCKISRLLFVDDLVLLASSESNLQHALNGCAAARDIAGVKISTSKTDTTSFKKSCPMFSANWRRIIEAVEVQVCCDRIHE